MIVKAELKAGTEGMSRSKRYKIVRYRAGLCINCGRRRDASPTSPSPYKRLCQTCGENKTKKRRKKMGSRPWKPGKPGRPPLKHTEFFDQRGWAKNTPRGAIRVTLGPAQNSPA